MFQDRISIFFIRFASLRSQHQEIEKSIQRKQYDMNTIGLDHLILFFNIFCVVEEGNNTHKKVQKLTLCVFLTTKLIFPQK